MSERENRISEEAAQRLWRRAAELQVAGERASAGRAIARGAETGLSLHEVASVAQSAGIDADCVRLAWAEEQLPDAGEIRPDQAALRWLRPIVGGDADAIEVDRTIDAPVADVLEAIRVVFAEPTYALVPELILGDDPVEDGVLVYRSVKTREAETFHESLNWADARVLLVLIRREGDRTRIRIRVPLFRRRFNLGLFGACAGLGGYGGGVAGWAVGGAVLGLSAPILALAVPAAAGAVTGAALTGRGFRGLYWWATNGGRNALLSLLNAVALRVDARAARIAAPTPLQPQE